MLAFPSVIPGARVRGAAMADLLVDLFELDDFAGWLSAIRRSLSTAKEIPDEYRADLGYDKLADALGKFVSNWRDGRKKIDKELESLEKMSRSIVDGLTQTDQQLADALHDHEDTTKI
jgi:hypothetical protein